VYPFDVSKHEVGRASSDPSYSETLKEMTSDPSILGLYLSFQGPGEVFEGMKSGEARARCGHEGDTSGSFWAR